MRSILLINYPTVNFTLSDTSAPNQTPHLGNAYNYTMPISLVRVATILERDLGLETEIVDLKASPFAKRQTYREVPFGSKVASLKRVGIDLDTLREIVPRLDAVGVSNHFTYESGIVREVIRLCRSIKPDLKILAGGADVKARPRFYLEAGADMAFVGDINTQAIAENDWLTPTIVPAHRYPFEGLSKPDFNKLQDVSIYSDSHDGPVPAGVTTPVGFAYFTRGCPRECDFCESRRTKFEALPLDAAFELLEHYAAAGIRTINFSDDNFLLLKRPYLEALLGKMRDLGFAWEFPNGLEIGRLVPKGAVDHDLVRLLFANSIDPVTGRHLGAYRAFIPVETFDRRANYKKLKPVEDQNAAIDAILSHAIPEINFGVVLSPDATEETFDTIEEGYGDIRKVLDNHPFVKSRFSIFHLIPIALYRSMNTLYTSEEFPEGWNFYFPVYDGKHFSATELFNRRVETITRIDPTARKTMETGTYSYA